MNPQTLTDKDHALRKVIKVRLYLLLYMACPSELKNCSRNQGKTLNWIASSWICFLKKIDGKRAVRGEHASPWRPEIKYWLSSPLCDVTNSGACT